MSKEKFTREEKENFFLIEKLLKKTGKLFEILYELENVIEYSFSFNYLRKNMIIKKAMPYKFREEFRGVKLNLPRILFIEDMLNKYQNESNFNMSQTFYRIIYELEVSYKKELKFMYRSVSILYLNKEIHALRDEYFETKKKFFKE